MSESKGILNEKTEDLAAQLLDELVHWKSPIMERLDKKLFKVAIKTIDNTLLEKIPEEWQNPLEPIVELALEGKWEEAGELIAKHVNDQIDIPFLDEESESLLFNSVISLVMGLIMSKVEEMRKK